MGNFTTKEPVPLQFIIDTTKQDISVDYNLFDLEEVTKANQELIHSFQHFSKKDVQFVKTQLFTQFTPLKI